MVVKRREFDWKCLYRPPSEKDVGDSVLKY